VVNEDRLVLDLVDVCSYLVAGRPGVVDSLVLVLADDLAGAPGCGPGLGGGEMRELLA
jgi:hypothetical protein